MGNTRGRVAAPRDAEGALKLAGKIYVKHQADGAASPLTQLEDYKWEHIGPNVLRAQELHELAEKLKAQMEAAYRDRDALMPDILGVTNSSKGLLKAKFSKTPKRLGDWGFDVDDTPRQKKGAES